MLANYQFHTTDHQLVLAIPPIHRCRPAAEADPGQPLGRGTAPESPPTNNIDETQIKRDSKQRR